MLRLASGRAAPMGRLARGLATEIPVGAVARVSRFEVADEAAAIKVDEIVKTMEPTLKGMPGYVKIVRSVCKTCATL